MNEACNGKIRYVCTPEGNNQQIELSVSTNNEDGFNKLNDDNHEDWFNNQELMAFHN